MLLAGDVLSLCHKKALRFYLQRQISALVPSQKQARYSLVRSTQAYTGFLTAGPNFLLVFPTWGRWVMFQNKSSLRIPQHTFLQVGALLLSEQVR